MSRWTEHKTAFGCTLAAGVLMVLMGLLGVAARLYDLHWERKVEAKLAEYRAAGEPVTWEDVLERRRQIPDGENSALLLLKGFGQLDDHGGGYDGSAVELLTDPVALGVRPSDALRGMLRANMEGNAGALAAVHEAAAFERGCYPLNESQVPIGVTVDHLSSLRQTARLCRLYAQSRAADGDATGAARALRDARALPASLGEETTPIELLVRVSADGIWTDSMERTLGLCELPADDVAALGSAAADEGARLSLVSGFYGERAMAHYVFSLSSGRELAAIVGSYRPGTPGERLAWSVYRAVPGLSERDAIFCYDYLDRAIAAARLPPRQAVREAKRVGDDLEKAVEAQPYTHIISAMLAPAVSRAITEMVAAKARLTVAQTALGVEQWRMKHGRWPDSLDELAPEFLDAVPEDPFSDGPVRYARMAKGVVVYSVGRDGKDDGGITREEARKGVPGGTVPQADGDLPFRLLAPELRRATTLSFREEIAAAAINLERLEKAGLTRQKLLDLGLTEDDLKHLAEQ